MIVNIPLAGNIHSTYSDMINYLRNSILDRISNELSEVIHPCTNIFEKWFQQNLPLRNVRVIFLVRNFLSPRELHIRKVSKYLTGRENQMTEEDLIKQGILILPFEYFELTSAHINNEYSIEEVNHTNNYINSYVMSAIGLSNPRERCAVVIYEDGFSQTSHFSNILDVYESYSMSPEMMGILDFGIYIDAGIPHTEMPIKLGTFYCIDAYQKREPKIINQFISQICHKL